MRLHLRAPLRAIGGAPCARCQHAGFFSTAAPRPRAAPRSPPSPRRSREARLAAGLAAACALLAAPVAYEFAFGGLTLAALRERAADAWAGLSRAGAAELLLLLLPAWESYDAGGGGAGGGGDPRGGGAPAVGRAGAPLARPRFTVVLGWEGVCVDVAYEPKAGFRALPRPGFAQLLLALAAAGAEVVVWSPTSPSAVVAEQLAGLVAGTVAPLDAGGYVALQARMEAAYARARDAEAAAAAREGRAPRAMLPITREDRVEQYTAHVLRVAAVLGSEHALPGGGGAAAVRPVAALTHERAPWDVVVVDALHRGAAGLPPAARARDAQHLALPEWRSAAQGAGEDPSLFLFAELALWFGGWRRAAERRAAAAQPPPVQPFTGRLTAEGFPATDPEASVAAFFEHALGGAPAFRARLDEGSACLALALLESARAQLQLRLREELEEEGRAAAAGVAE